MDCRANMSILWGAIVYLVLLQFSYESEPNADRESYVECKSQQENCVCEENRPECRFRLKIEEIQTFTSYKYRSNSQLLVRGFSGNTYYFNNTGIHSSLPSALGPGYSPCLTDNITRLADFSSINCSIPMMVDGRTYHSIIAVNDRIPGPTLIVAEGQKVVVDVRNELASEGVTVHWHGVHQKGTPWMDGVGFVSQVPIMPGSVFRYTFTASPVGTHWYHSHVGTQRIDGFFGALVIREKSDTLKEIKHLIGNFEDIPERHTLTLFDFLRENSLGAYVKDKSSLDFYSAIPLENVPQESDVFDAGITTTDGSSLGPIPYWSGLINGRGRYNANTYSLLSVFNVDIGKTYRFRVVGAQGLYVYKLEIIGHKLKVISSDGHLFVPVEVDYLIVHTGERYDFLLSADKEPGNYFIRAQVLGVTGDPGDNDFVNLTADAILHYNDVSVPNPNPHTLYDNVIDAKRRCGPTERCRAINCPFKEFPSEFNIDCVPLNDLQSLFPIKDNYLPSLRTLLGDNSTLFLNFGFDGNIADSSVNGRTFKLPPTPYQTYPGQFDEDLQFYPLESCQYCRGVNESTFNCDCTYVVQIAKDKKFSNAKSNVHVLMVFSALTLELTQEFHPIHLHGHNFFVIHIEHGHYENGVLQSRSEHIDCESRCLDPKWNRTVPDFSKYMTKNGKLINTTILKDTVIVPAGGYVVVAVELNNPGYWFLHCHSEPHLFKGMAVIIQEYPEDQHPEPPHGINKVGHFYDTEEQPSPGSDVWMVGTIVALLLATIALVVAIAEGIVIVRIKDENMTMCSNRSRRKNGTKYSVFNEQGFSSSEEMDSSLAIDVQS